MDEILDFLIDPRVKAALKLVGGVVGEITQMSARLASGEPITDEEVAASRERRQAALAGWDAAAPQDSP